jgi:uncharacterized protein (TIGR03067 family)
MIWQTMLLLAGGLLFASEREEATKKAHAQLEGVWSFALVEFDGKMQPAVPFRTHKMIISKDGHYAVVQGPRVTRGTLKLDPTATPKHYDPTITTGPRKSLTVSGIYELDGDTLKICFPLRSKERPAALASKPGSGLLFQVFNREKQDLKEALIEANRTELTGTWKAVSYSLDGNKAADEDMKRIELAIEADGKATALREGKVFIAGTTRIDPTSNPMTIDVTYTEGDPKGQTALGIFKIEDDLLTICRSAPDKARPTEFSSKPGSGHTLMTYRREKKTK